MTSPIQIDRLLPVQYILNCCKLHAYRTSSPKGNPLVIMLISVLFKQGELKLTWPAHLHDILSESSQQQGYNKYRSSPNFSRLVCFQNCRHTTKNLEDSRKNFFMSALFSWWSEQISEFRKLVTTNWVCYKGKGRLESPYFTSVARNSHL